MSESTTRSTPDENSVDDEFAAATTSAAIVDRSSVGKLLITGADRIDLLHRLTTNDLLHLKPFSARMTVFATDKGRIVDYVRVLVFPESLVLITSPGQDNLLMSWIDKYTIMEDIQIKAVTSSWAMFSLLGPEAQAKAGEMFGHLPKADTPLELEFASTKIIVDYQREFSISTVHILVPSEHAPIVFGQLKKAGKELGIGTMSSTGFECFRIFHGIPGEKCELTYEFNPLEVGLVHAVSWTKGCFVGQEVIARLDTYQKVQRKLVRMSLEKELRGIRCPVPLTKNGQKVGVLSSIAPVQLRGEYIALGMVRNKGVMVEDTLITGTELFEVKGIITDVFHRSLR